MDHVTVQDIAEFLENHDITGDQVVIGAKPLAEAAIGDISLVRSTIRNSIEATEQTQAVLLIADQDVDISPAYKGCVIRSKNARLDFMRVLENFFAPKPKQSVHPSAVIGQNVTLGDNVVIHANVTVYDNVMIGDNSIIHSGCVIGADGFGFERDENGVPVKFPHIGGVRIGKNVEIMGLTHVARGALGDTEIGDFTKIDGQCHIAHNVKIGKRCLITAGVTFAGSVTVGDDVYIAPAASIINRVTIGDKAFIGMAAFVKNDVEAGVTVVGSPAHPLPKK